MLFEGGMSNQTPNFRLGLPLYRKKLVFFINSSLTFPKYLIEEE